MQEVGDAEPFCASLQLDRPGRGDSVATVDVVHRRGACRARVDVIGIGSAARGNRGRVERDDDLCANARHRECRVQRAGFDEAGSSPT